MHLCLLEETYQKLYKSYVRSLLQAKLILCIFYLYETHTQSQTGMVAYFSRQVSRSWLQNICAKHISYILMVGVLFNPYKADFTN